MAFLWGICSSIL